MGQKKITDREKNAGRDRTEPLGTPTVDARGMSRRSINNWNTEPIRKKTGYELPKTRRKAGGWKFRNQSQTLSKAFKISKAMIYYYPKSDWKKCYQ